MPDDRARLGRHEELPLQPSHPQTINSYTGEGREAGTLMVIPPMVHHDAVTVTIGSMKVEYIEVANDPHPLAAFASIPGQKTAAMVHRTMDFDRLRNKCPKDVRSPMCQP
jgi:hypothetical protein